MTLMNRARSNGVIRFEAYFIPAIMIINAAKRNAEITAFEI